ncbi:MAG: Flp pilus assembly complex ATPase component TadA, partial [Deinococcota bacterium]|nr:Flp pilus assembly complex ATPase component TadA [Deinococcota bacterium]
MSDQTSSQRALDIIDLLKLSVTRRASDLILTAGLPPMLRVDGEWQKTGYEVLTPKLSRRLMYAIMDEKRQRTFEEHKELDFSFALTGFGRFRVNVFFQRAAVSGVLRMVPEEVMSFETMGLPATVANLARQPRGLVLVTGPTGSGK